MPEHDVAQVCLNGHLVNGRSKTCPTLNKDFCGKCGAKTSTTCPNCATPIPGCLLSETTATTELSPDEFCHKCGKSFPWKGKRQSAGSPESADKTVFDIWKAKLLNNKIAAAVMLAAMVIGGAAAVWKELPDDWKQQILGSSKTSGKTESAKQSENPAAISGSPVLPPASSGSPGLPPVSGTPPLPPAPSGAPPLPPAPSGFPPLPPGAPERSGETSPAQ